MYTQLTSPRMPTARGESAGMDTRITGFKASPLRGVTRITGQAPQAQANEESSAPVDSVANISSVKESSSATSMSPASALRTATITALRTAALTSPGASYLLAPAESAYRGRLDIEKDFKSLKPYAKKRLGELPQNLSLGQVLAHTGAKSLTELVKNKGKFEGKLNELKSLGKDFQGTLLVREDAPGQSLAVIADTTVPEQTRVTSFSDAMRNETARADILGLFQNPKFKDQLKGSKLESVKAELARPGTDVKSILNGAMSELEGGYTAAHSKRAIETIGKPLAEAAGLSKAEQSAVAEVSGFYDIGKLAVNQEILDFPGRWPEDKRGSWFGQVSNHVNPEIVDPLLKAYGVSDLGREAVLHHHENPGGRPYNKEKPTPAWSEISPAAKVVGMADTIDAMMNSKANHNRPEARPLEQAEVQKRLEGDAENGRVDGKLVELAFSKVL